MRAWLVEKRAHETQTTFGKKLGISQSYLVKLEAGTQNPSVPLAKRLAKILDVDWTRFFEKEA